MKKTVLQPMEDRVLVDPDPAPAKVSGLQMTEQHQKNHQPPRGTVVAVGPGLPDKPMPFKPGDRIMYGAYANMEVEDPHTKHKFLCIRVADCFVRITENDEKENPSD